MSATPSEQIHGFQTQVGSNFGHLQQSVFWILSCDLIFVVCEKSDTSWTSSPMDNQLQLLQEHIPNFRGQLFLNSQWTCKSSLFEKAPGSVDSILWAFFESEPVQSVHLDTNKTQDSQEQIVKIWLASFPTKDPHWYSMCNARSNTKRTSENLTDHSKRAKYIAVKPSSSPSSPSYVLLATTRCRSTHMV